MPRPKKLIPSYRHHRASGQAIVVLNGKVHYLGPHGTKTSRLEYDRLIAEWLVRGRCAEGTDGMNVRNLIARYLRYAKTRYTKNGRPTSELTAIKVALRFVRVLYDKTPADDIGPVAVKAVRLRMIDAGLARTTINQHVGRIRRMLRWAVSEQLLPPEVHQSAAALEGLRKGCGEAKETAPVLPIDDAKVEVTLEHLPAVIADMVRLQRLTGMRPSEVCILRPCDIDRSADVWIYKPTEHKTQHHDLSRTIFVGPQAQAILLRYLARDGESYCFQPRDSEAKRRAEQHARRKTPLNCGARPGTNQKRNPKRSPGDCYTVAAYRRAIHRACDRAFPHPTLCEKHDLDEAQVAELKSWRTKHRWSPNRLRHAAATDARRRFGLEAAQILLGHTKANVTQLYAERDVAKGVEVARLIG